MEAERCLVPPFKCDFYIDKHTLVLEANGMQHYRQSGQLTNSYELFRCLYQEEGFRVVHYDFQKYNEASSNVRGKVEYIKREIREQTGLEL